MLISSPHLAQGLGAYLATIKEIWSIGLYLIYKKKASIYHMNQRFS